MDAILRIFLLLAIMATFVTIYEVWQKLHGVKLKKLQRDIEEIKALLYAPFEEENEDSEKEVKE